MIDVNAEAADRARRRLDDALKPVDERLHQWGRFTKNGAPKLGYSDKASHLQPPQDAIMVPAPTFIPPEIVEVDACIARLSNISQKVLAIAYMHFPAWPPNRQRARLNMSRHKWERTLREARLMIAAILGYDLTKLYEKPLNPDS